MKKPKAKTASGAGDERTIYHSTKFPGLAGVDADRLRDAEGRLGYEIVNRSPKLALGSLHLTSLPENLSELTFLTTLNVDSNQLTSVPESLGQLSKLQILRLHSNQLTSVPETLGRLTRLQELYLFDNRLTSLPDSLVRLSKLEMLDLEKNQFTSLPEWLRELAVKGDLKRLFLHQNVALGIPDEVLGPDLNDVVGKKATAAKALDILNYYFTMRGGRARALRELKVILVGRGEVGKTTLVDVLQKKRFAKKRAKTEGIAITPWEVDLKDGVEDGKATAHVWDFGGQQIMHGTHQFFMTHRAIYLVVLDGRDDRTRQEAEYWLKLVRAFGGEDSPVLMVLNKQGEHPYSVDSEYFVQKYRIKPEHIFRTECADPKDAGVARLREAILTQAAGLLAKRELFPAAWWEMKMRLAGMRDRKEDHLSQARYHKLCIENKVPKEQCEALLKVLSELGVVVSFPDEMALADLLVLNPEWATDGVYRVLNDRTLVEKHAEQRGQVTLEDLRRILPEERWQGPHLHRYLLALMEKFELCFPMEGDANTVLVPELLPDETPNLDAWKDVECLVFLYRYPALPQGVLPRFITRTHALSVAQSRWRSGVILQGEGAQALVKADYDENEVSIWIRGKAGSRRAALLAQVRGHLDVIHGRIKNLGEEALLTVPRHPKVTIPLEDVLLDEVAGRRTVRLKVEGERVEVSIIDLLQGLNPVAEKRKLPRRGMKGDIHIEKYIAGDHIEEQIVAHTVQKFGGTGNTYQGPIAVHQDFKDCYHQIQQLPDSKESLKAAVVELLEQLSNLHPKLAAPAATSVTDAVAMFTAEVVRPEPKVKRLQLGVEELMEAIRPASANKNKAVAKAAQRMLEAAGAE